jgi:hypothetical protein
LSAPIAGRGAWRGWPLLMLFDGRNQGKLVIEV